MVARVDRHIVAIAILATLDLQVNALGFNDFPKKGQNCPLKTLARRRPRDVLEAANDKTSMTL